MEEITIPNLLDRIDDLTTQLERVTEELSRSKRFTDDVMNVYSERVEEQKKFRFEAETKARAFSDLARKFGLLHYDADISVETAAHLEVSSLAHLPLERIVDFVDLHSALSRQFAELARSKASELDIAAARTKKAKNVRTAVTQARELPQLKKEEKRQLSENKAENKALAKLMKTGISEDVAKSLLEAMKGK